MSEVVLKSSLGLAPHRAWRVRLNKQLPRHASVGSTLILTAQSYFDALRQMVNIECATKHRSCARFVMIEHKMGKHYVAHHRCATTRLLHFVRGTPHPFNS